MPADHTEENCEDVSRDRLLRLARDARHCAMSAADSKIKQAFEDLARECDDLAASMSALESGAQRA